MNNRYRLYAVSGLLLAVGSGAPAVFPGALGSGLAIGFGMFAARMLVDAWDWCPVCGDTLDDGHKHRDIS